jgi:predicted phage tail protein
MLPGPDGRYGTGDEVTRLIALLGSGAPSRRPMPPTSVNATSTGPNVRLAWLAPHFGPTASSYIIEAGTAPGRADLGQIHTNSPATSLLVPSVSPGKYYVRVRTVTPQGISMPSAEAIVPVNAACSSAPARPTVQIFVSGATATIAWSRAPMATGYVLEAGARSGMTDVARFSTGTAATSFIATNVPPGRYFVRIRATNDCGTSSHSNEVAVVIP